MMSSINYKYTIFEHENITPVHGEPTFKTLHKLRNKINANAKSIYSNLGGGAHGYLGLVIRGAQYALISNTLFVYSTHPGPLIILDGTTTHVSSNM